MPDLEKFRALGLSELSIEALAAKGFEEPSPIQEKVIPLLLSGKKGLIGQAQTGTGKTAAYGLPIIELVEGGAKQPAALILSPTRELCLQIVDELNSLRGDKKLSIAAIYGGEPVEYQIHNVKKGVDIAVGTPGRIIDLIERGVLKLDRIQFAILDEADEMLDMGFVEDIEHILEGTPEEKRMLMFSATMPQQIQKIAERFMRSDYEIVRTEMNRLAVELTDQSYYEVRRENKLEALSRLIDITDDMYAMIFCRTRSDVDDLVEALHYRGYPVEALHGDIAQAQRTKVITRFKEGKFKLLIATDVAARGIDVNGLSHVINFSIPTSTEAYVHRIGRTGRAGRQGKAVTFVTPGETRTLQRIRREANADIKREAIPLATDVLEAKKRRVASKITEMIAGGEHTDYLSFAEELLAICDHPAEIVSSLLKLKYAGELLENTYGDINISRDSTGRRRDRDEVKRGAMARLFFSVGRADGIGPGDMLDIIYDRSHVRKSNIGRIDMKDKCSFVEVPESYANTVVTAFRNSDIRVNDADSASYNEQRQSQPKKRFQPHDKEREPLRKPLAHKEKDFRDKVLGDTAPDFEYRKKKRSKRRD